MTQLPIERVLAEEKARKRAIKLAERLEGLRIGLTFVIGLMVGVGTSNVALGIGAFCFAMLIELRGDALEKAINEKK